MLPVLPPSFPTRRSSLLCARRHRRRPCPRPDHPDRLLELFGAQGALTVAAAFEEASMSDKPRGRRRRILIVIGTRPEAIKMAPVVLALRREPWVDVRIVATAQHRQMLDQVLVAFGLAPDIDLDIMRPDQSLPELTARLLLRLDRVFADEAPDAVLAQGDTTTAMAVALAAFYRRIPVGHVEAGLRPGALPTPSPGEDRKSAEPQ